jgi:hypothetical protein
MDIRLAKIKFHDSDRDGFVSTDLSPPLLELIQGLPSQTAMKEIYPDSLTSNLSRETRWRSFVDAACWG